MADLNKDDGGGKLASRGLKYSPIRTNKFRRASSNAIKSLSLKKKRCKYGILILKCLGVLLLLTLFVVGVVGSIFMWTTDKFDETVLENLVLKNNTKSFEWWQTPPVEPLMRVHIFNYTNVERFLAGEEKPHVQEVGPYTFRQTITKVNVKFYDNGTVSYQEKVNFSFVPELSVGNPEDNYITVLNVPFMGAVAMMEDSSYLTKVAIATTMRSLNSKPFLNLNANEVMWGYKEALVNLAKIFSSFGIDPDSLKLGILEFRGGIQRTRVTVDTGINNISRLGIISRVDGEDHLDAWGGTSCSQVDGSDGTLFPPQWVREKRQLHIFNKELCRKLPLEFNKEVEVKGGIPAYQYSPPNNSFLYGKMNPDNDCFCKDANGDDEDDEKVCPVDGVSSVSPCTFGAPAFVSFPHFYLGDKRLFENVHGLQPDEKKHRMYLNLHPTLGVPMGGHSRLQFNIKVRKSNRLNHLENFVEGSYMPVMWLELGLDELPPEVRGVFYSATYTVRSLELGLKYGFLVLAFVTGLVLFRLTCRQLIISSRSRTSTTDAHVLEPL